MRGVSFATPTKVSNNQIHLKISGGLPHQDKIVYSPTHEYLKYNPFNLGTNSHSFKIIFSSESTTWAGKGDLGMTVDNNISKGNGLQKIDW